MTITVYGKKKCGLCNSAKEKIEKMGFSYDFIDLEIIPENWKEIGIRDAMAEYNLQETLPIIKIDNDYMLYPTAMKLLKNRKV